MFSVVIAVGVKEDAESSEVVLATKDRTDLALLLCVPEGKPIAKQVLPLTMHLELNHNLPVVHTNWLQVYTRERQQPDNITKYLNKLHFIR